MIKTYQVARTHVSPYQNKDFLKIEKELIEEIPGLSYRTLEELTEEPVILLTNTHTQLRNLPAKVLAKTELIVHPNSGYDHFAPEHDLWRNIPLVIGHRIRAQAVAEFSLSAIFEGLVALPRHLAWDRNRKWDRTLLAGSEVWVFGYGHIGSVVADTLGTLGLSVTVVDPFITRCPHRRLAHWQDGDLTSARVVVSAMSLNRTSRHLWNKDFFSALGNEVLLVNGARGGHIDERELKDYLARAPRSFAFLDVFEREPFGDEWHGVPQVWKTSHIAGVEKELDNKILKFETGILRDFLAMAPAAFTERYGRELLQNKWIKGELI